jgi:hypothetical protein
MKGVYYKKRSQFLSGECGGNARDDNNNQSHDNRSTAVSSTNFKHLLMTILMETYSEKPLEKLKVM